MRIVVAILIGASLTAGCESPEPKYPTAPFLQVLEECAQREAVAFNEANEELREARIQCENSLDEQSREYEAYVESIQEGIEGRVERAVMLERQTAKYAAQGVHDRYANGQEWVDAMLLRFRSIRATWRDEHEIDFDPVIQSLSDDFMTDFYDEELRRIREHVAREKSYRVLAPGVTLNTLYPPPPESTKLPPPPPGYTEPKP